MTPHSPLVSAWWDSRWGDLQGLTSCMASALDTRRWLGASATLLLACFAEGDWWRWPILKLGVQGLAVQS